MSAKLTRIPRQDSRTSLELRRSAQNSLSQAHLPSASGPLSANPYFLQSLTPRPSSLLPASSFCFSFLCSSLLLPCLFFLPPSSSASSLPLPCFFPASFFLLLLPLLLLCFFPVSSFCLPFLCLFSASSPLLLSASPPFASSLLPGQTFRRCI